MPLKEFLLKKPSFREILPQVQPARHTKGRYIISCQHNLASHLHDVDFTDMKNASIVGPWKFRKLLRQGNARHPVSAGVL